MMLKPLLPARDPTGELMAMVGRPQRRRPTQCPRRVWASRDGERAMLLIQTAALGSDTDGQERPSA